MSKQLHRSLVLFAALCCLTVFWVPQRAEVEGSDLFFRPLWVEKLPVSKDAVALYREQLDALIPRHEEIQRSAPGSVLANADLRTYAKLMSLTGQAYVTEPAMAKSVVSGRYLVLLFAAYVVASALFFYVQKFVVQTDNAEQDVTPAA